MVSSLATLMDLLSALNPAQRDAVEHTEGPLLILAGAGSGKTRVITIASRTSSAAGSHARTKCWRSRSRTRPPRRCANASSSSLGDDCRAGLAVDVPFAVRAPAAPRSAGDRPLARLRDLRLVGPAVRRQAGAEDARTSTTSSCRRAPRSAASARRRTRWNRRRRCAQPAGACATSRSAAIYEIYLRALTEAGALDFDDLLLKTVELVETSERVREFYARKFRYILVDEYQDTNRPQYLLIRRLAEVHRNLCVVGDPDQSIYRWRGADLRNILDFEHDFPDAHDRQARAELPVHAGDSRRRLGRHPAATATARTSASGPTSRAATASCYVRAGDEIEEADYITRADPRARSAQDARPDGRRAVPHERAVARH